MPGKDLPPYLEEVRQIAAARVALARGEYQKVLKLDTILPETNSSGRGRHVLEMNLLMALAHEALEERQ
ncbi:MAG: hypothetical protein JXA25_11705 [Anaerolineales bacterium]|nr:hypothetical protein [Anaerolineales bacterium]